MFSSKRKLSVHLCRMQTGFSENNGEDGTSTPSTSCPKINQSPAYISSKPYQCAVCCVSYSCSVSLKSHLRSVLHQTRSRNAEGPSSCTAENLKNSKSITSSTNCVVNSANSMSTSPSITLSLHNASASASSIALPQVTSQQKFLSLSVGNLNTQNQNLNPDAPGQVLTPDLSSAQVLLAERTHDLQSLGLSVAFSMVQSISSEEKMKEKAEDTGEVVDEMVNKEASDGVQFDPENANLPLKYALYTGEKIKEGYAGVKGIGYGSPLKCTKKGAAKDGEENGMGGENTTDTNYGEQMQFKHCQNGEMQFTVPCEMAPQCSLAFQATPDTILPESGPLPCSTSPSSSTQLIASNLQFSLRPSNTLPKSHPDISSNHCLTDHLEFSPDDNERKAHFTLPRTDSDPSAVAHQDSSGLNLKSSRLKQLMLSDFQSQVLWAFLESQSQADVVHPSQQDCEELAREVGLGVEEIHRWFGHVQKTKERQNGIGWKDGIYPVTMVVDHRKDIRKRNHDKNVSNREIGRFCQTSESDRGEFYTAAIVTDEESQSSLQQDEQSNPAKVGNHDEDGITGERKVLLSDEGKDRLSFSNRNKRRKILKQEVVNTKEKLNPDGNLQLGTPSDSRAPLVSFEQGSLCRISTGTSLPLSIAPVNTPLSPHILSLPPSVVGLGISKNAKADQGKYPILPKLLTTDPYCYPLKMPLFARHTPLCQTLSGKDDNESALDLRIGKNCSPVPASSTSTSANKIPEKNQLFKGLGLNAIPMGTTETSGLIVDNVKPNCTFSIPTSNHSSINKMNNGIKAAEQINNSKSEKETKGEQQEERDCTSKDFQLLRGRSRTIIQPEQLDVLYGCYFKEPNPAKHEFAQISEWVKLPKRVVQIWFQNMRARERKGEVRFLGNGTLAAVGKPLIKFTWPLSPPVISRGTNPNIASLGDHKLCRVTADACVKTPLGKDVERETKNLTNAKLMTSSSSNVRSLIVSKTGTQLSSPPKAKPFTKASNFSVPFAIIETRPPHLPQNCKRDKDYELHDKVKENDNEDESESHITGPASTSRMVPKVPLTPVGKHSGSQKQNGLNYWATKAALLSMNSLPNEHLGLPSQNYLSRISISSPPVVLSNPGMHCNNNLQQCIPRRPRTLLTNLQLSILQSCYEICPHPNAAECEVLGLELKLPQRVVQIWFQNTRAKEKRWYLQQEKQSLDTKDLSNRVNFGSSGYLQYRALRANRPILPKPVQITLLVSSAPSDVGQSTSHEALKGRCEVCSVGFESRAAGRVHVFSSQHLSALRASNFGQLPSHVSKGTSIGSGTVSGVPLVSSLSI